MNFRTIVKIMPNLWKNRVLSILVAVCVFLVFILILGIGRISIAMSNAEKVHKETNDKKAFVQEWKMNALNLRNSVHKPIGVSEIESLQGTVLRDIYKHRLTLVAFSVLGGKTDEGKTLEGIDFELSFTGPWDASVRFIQEFALGHALVAVKSVKMEPEGSGLIKTLMRYKIFVKQG